MTYTNEEYQAELEAEIERLETSQAQNPSEYKEERIRRLKNRINQS